MYCKCNCVNYLLLLIFYNCRTCKKKQNKKDSKECYSEVDKLYTNVIFSKESETNNKILPYTSKLIIRNN